MRSIFSAMTTFMPAQSSAYGDCSRLDPLPRRFPLTAATKSPRFTSPRWMGTSLPHFKPVYGNSPSVSSKKKQMCAGVISSVEISSRSLGLLFGFLVSQGRSSPASWRLINSGSSVRNRILPGSRTVVGRFSIFLFSKASITESASLVQSCSILRRRAAIGYQRRAFDRGVLQRRPFDKAYQSHLLRDLGVLCGEQVLPTTNDSSAFWLRAES